jgi:hypothetical protein
MQCNRSLGVAAGKLKLKATLHAGTLVRDPGSGLA